MGGYMTRLKGSIYLEHGSITYEQKRWMDLYSRWIDLSNSILFSKISP